MELKVWAKTLLTVYKYLEKIAGTIDKLVVDKSLNTISDDAFNVANEILKLTERKITLINLKVLIESALSKLSEQKSKLLILKFFDCLTCEDTAKLEGISIRTYFRHIDNALTTFTSELKLLGLDENYIDYNFKHEKWLYSLYNRLLAQELNKKQSCTQKDNIELQNNILKLLCNAYGARRNQSFIMKA
ncbi:MAG: sigma factor-like helix-turn-helix DNA-binding protein [Clostridia bacterium]|jgi:hypothetical protein|nr:hypothetical protein [Clostridia bacterium]MDD4275641.1 sigma factor-like helix-turn-helix DNA-binding protein [Clostridia bacterium]